MAEGDDWTTRELKPAVRAYFDYLWGEDVPPKAEVYRGLSEGPIPDRSIKSIERKLQNISAVLSELSLPWIDGLAPASNYQASLAKEVRQFLTDARKANYKHFCEAHPSPDADFRSQKWRGPLEHWLARLFCVEQSTIKCYGTSSDAEKQQTRLVQQGAKARFLSISFSKGRAEHDAFVAIVESSRDLWALPSVSCVAISYVEGRQWRLGTLVARPKSLFVPMVQNFLKDDVEVRLVDAPPDTLSATPLGISLNTILYGPPGTGKTYSTVARALAICGVPYRDRASALADCQRLNDAGRIRFVTFHQSFSYEDFVEGIRPEIDEATQQVIYEPRDGVFKEICARAASRRTKEALLNNIEGRRFWKMSLGNTRLDESDIYQSCIDEGVVKLGWGSGTDFSGCDTREQVFERLRQDDPRISRNDYGVTAMNILKNEINIGDLVIVSDGNHRFRAIAEVTGPYEFRPDPWGQMRSVKWLASFDPSLPREQLFKRAISQMTLYELKPATLKLDQLADLVVDKPKGDGDPCVLIIDEINRANISKVFGELITLIEQDKRLGGRDEKRVVLPYSREEFGVPPNVFVIGTMNTADRSIAGLDIALRRRFEFIEMTPDPDLLESVVGEIDGISAGNLLRTINRRIEFLLDREHAIGHSYFMTVASLDDLADVFRTRVIPLLQEYFHGDLSKVAWVLGCGFDDDGKTSNAKPLIRGRLLTAADVFSANADFEDRLQAAVDPGFLSAAGNDLVDFFKGVLS